MWQSTSLKHLHFSLLGRGSAGLMLVLEDELSGAASVNFPELYQENYSFFLLVQVCIVRAGKSPIGQSEVG